MDVSASVNSELPIKQEVELSANSVPHVKLEFEVDLCTNNELGLGPDFRQTFESQLIEHDEQHQGSQRKPWTKKKLEDVINNVRLAKDAVKSELRRTPMQYYWMSKYDLLTTANGDHLIFKKKSTNDSNILIIPRNDYYDVIKEAHETCSHGGRDKILNTIKTRFYIPKKAVEIFVALCPTCENKRNGNKRGSITRPTVSQDLNHRNAGQSIASPRIKSEPVNLNNRGQVDLLDFQSYPDGEYKWLLVYRDDSTKFLNLRPLKTNNANEVAVELMKIFATFGAPCTLQSTGELTDEVGELLAAKWPELRIVHGGPETQGSVESSQNVGNELRSWMSDNKSTNWSFGCYHTQYYKNISVHHAIGRSPYEALFGNTPIIGLSSPDTPPSIDVEIKTEPLSKVSQQEVLEVNPKKPRLES